MINLKLLLGMVPATAGYESKQESLRKEYADLLAFEESKELADFIELEKIVLSPEFARKKKEIMGQRYSDTEEYQKEKEYLALSKRKEVKRYYKTLNSVELRDFLEFDKSYDVKHYHTLEKLIHSEEFLKLRRSLSKKEFNETEEYEKYTEFRNLKASDRFRNYFRFMKSKDYVNFTLLAGSEKIMSFEELGRYLQSEPFQTTKDYMLLPARKKLELSEEYTMEQQYLSMKNSEKFQWYFKTKNSGKFDAIRRWKLTFSDEFDSKAVDTKKWLTRYFWGEALLNDSYVNEAERQFYTGEENIRLDNSVLQIQTRREKVSGKVWNPSIGFYPRDFEYSSAIINSGSSFRQQYGLFEAKMRFNRNYPVNHSFWLLSDLILPHIDIARAGKKISMGSYRGNPNVKGGIEKVVSAVNRSKYGNDFYIFSLEWTKEKLTWKVNGVTVASTARNVPQMPMFMNISSSLYKDVNGSVLPASMEVDWVRCYQEV